MLGGKEAFNNWLSVREHGEVFEIASNMFNVYDKTNSFYVRVRLR
jgi:hypothetical protein